MDEQNTPGLDAPATRTIVGLLVGIVLTAGAFLGGYLAFGGNNDSKPLVTTTQENKLSPSAAKVKVWHLDAGRIIGPVITGLANVNQEDRAAVCRIVDKGRIDALTQIPTVPDVAIDRMYRQWVQDIAGVEMLCSKKAGLEEINKQISVSGTSFAVFFEAIETVAPFDTRSLPQPPVNNNQNPTAPNQGIPNPSSGK